MKPSDPCCDVRASARAAALSDAMSGEMQEVADGDLVVQPEVRGRRARDVGSRDRDDMGQIGIVLEDDGGRHHLRDARNRSLVSRVLFPEDLVGLGIVDDRRGCPQIGNQIAARVDLVARDDRVGHLAAVADGTALRGRGPAGARRRFRGRFRRGLFDRRFRAGLRRCSRDARQTDEASERKVTDPENWFLAHESWSRGCNLSWKQCHCSQTIDRPQGNYRFQYTNHLRPRSRAEPLPTLCHELIAATFRALRADIRRIGHLKSTR